MSFRIINPGYGCLLDRWDAYHLTKTYENNLYNPTNNVAFYTTEFVVGGYDLPETVQNGDVFCIKFDVYIPPYDTSLGMREFSIGLNNDESKFTIGVTISNEHRALGLTSSIKDSSGNSIFKYDLLPSADTVLENTKFILGAVNTIYVKFEIGTANSANSKIEFLVNDNTFFSGENITVANVEATKVNFNIPEVMPVANLIISNAEVTPYETILTIPGTIETAMTLNDDGTYTATQIGAQLLQTLDTVSLSNSYGNGKILDCLAIAAPAYTTGTDITKLKCRQIYNGVTTDYTAQDLKSYTEQDIEDLSDAIELVSEKINLATDTTLANINGMKIGWVTEE